MRAVANELGTSASALYRYVNSRDELLDVMVDATMADFAFTPHAGQDWLAEMVRLAESTRSLYVRQPWLMDVRPARSSPGPNTLAWFEHCLRAMESLDRPIRSKMEAIGVLNGVIMLFARNAVAPAAIDFGAMDRDRHPRLANALTNPGPYEPAGDLFERTVRAMLVGLLQ